MSEQQQQITSTTTTSVVTTFVQQDQHVDANTNKNTQLITCRLCQSKILKPQTATFVSSTETIPDVATGTRQYDEWWVVNDMFQFENIGFTRLSAEQAQIMQGRFMCCADCEHEPIGFVKSGNQYYVAARMLGYK